MTHGSFFSGFGGFDLAAASMGWENAFHVEINPFCRTVLKYHFPNAKSYEDITKTDFTGYRGTIDIVSGGFPCQPYSMSGKRLGTADDRHLWPEMLRGIREINPVCVVGENVRGIISWNAGMVFEQVQLDLENLGFKVIPVILPACAINAPHRRDRVFFVAYSESNRDRRELRGLEKENGGKREPKEYGQENLQPWDNGKERDAANSCRAGLERENRPSVEESIKPSEFASPNPNGVRLWGEGYGAGKSKFVLQNCAGYNWKDFPTQSPVCGGDDGLPTELDGITFSKWRRESLKGYGNAVVPQLALQIFKVIENMNNGYRCT